MCSQKCGFVRSERYERYSPCAVCATLFAAVSEPTHNQILGAAVRYIRERRKLRQEDVAKHLGILRANYAKKETGKERIDPSWWPVLSKAFGMSEGKLRKEIDEVIAERPLGFKFVTLGGEHSRTRDFASHVAAGVPVRGRRSNPSQLPITPELVGDPGAFAFEVTDDSMSPQFIEGDVVVLSPAAEVRDGDACLVQRESGDTLRLVFRAGDNLELRPANARRHQSAVVATGSVRVVKAVGCYRRVG